MYHPYFRGKLNELIVVREKAELLSANNICPIIEPVKESFNGVFRTFDAVNNANGSATLIVNPEHGFYKDLPERVSQVFGENLTANNRARAGILLREDTSLDELSRIKASHQHHPLTCIHAGYSDPDQIINKFQTNKDVIHLFLDNKCGLLYRKRFSNMERFLVKDGFIKRSNKDYPNSEFFSELHVTYDEMNLDGFGDYLIVGDDYTESGGPAWAVAIHLTYINSLNDNVMDIFHFKSDRSDTNTDAPGKFAEALEKLVREVNQKGSMVLHTDAVKEFLSLHRRGHFPGLGYVKKLSMQHHLETLAEFISR